MPPKTQSAKKITDTYLLIVESPSKCAKIESYLGDKYKCISSKGHIQEIDGLSSIKTADKFQIEYTLIAEKKDHVESMRKTVAKYSPLNILLATDDDREGEAIAWHICQVCSLDVFTTKRIIFHEITQPALLVAVANPVRINLSLVAAQQARQVLDLVVGYKISPLLWRHLGGNRKNALSAGRCQTPALRLVFDHNREYTEARASEIQQIYKVSGIFTNRGIKFDLNCDITSQESLLDFLERTKTHDHRLSIGATKPSTRSPPKPFNTSRLLQTASNLYRISPKRTMELCQVLYQSGLITYMRTECQKYSDVFLQKIATFITAEYGEAFIGDFGAIALVDASMPHEGIRVTNLALKKMTSDDPMLSKMYGLIWRNTVESCMATARYNMTDYMIDSPSLSLSGKKPSYKYTMETPVFLGWRRLEINYSVEEQTTTSSLAFYLEQIEKTGHPLSWSLIESKTTIESRLPSHYTEASLIQTLEDLGIGRPSTFSSIVETIQERGYAKKTNISGIKQQCTEYKLRQSSPQQKNSDEEESSGMKNCSSIFNRKNTRKVSASSSLCVLEKTELEKIFGEERDKLVIQPTGILVVEFLLQHFEDIFSYDYTKSMETELDAISSLPSDTAMNIWHEICRKCFDDITERSKPLAKQAKQTFALSDTADHVLVFNTYGVSIKSLFSESSSVYSKIRPEIELDLEKAKRGEYTMAELIWREDNGCLGEYRGSQIYLKKGKFGLYAEWCDSTASQSKKQTISLKPLDKPANEIVLKDVVALIEKKSTVLGEEEAAAMFLPQSVFGEEDEGIVRPVSTATGSKDKSVLRHLRPDLSIRKGKYGPYIFHQTVDMPTPKFYPIKQLKTKWESMDNLELIAAIENTYHISI
jgi:DNA topoisomerase-1